MVLAPVVLAIVSIALVIGAVHLYVRAKRQGTSASGSYLSSVQEEVDARGGKRESDTGANTNYERVSHSGRLRR